MSTVSPCFTPGTLIATDRGHRPVETLRAGDRVVTRDNGLKRIYWIGKRQVAYHELQRAPEIRPVLIRKDAFGTGRPTRDMLVSPNHRFLLIGDQSLGQPPEALLSAARLVDGRRVVGASVLGISYIHLLCDRHQVILANGAWTESFHPDDAVMRALGNSQRLELITLFPEIATIGAARRFGPARPIVDGRSLFER